MARKWSVVCDFVQALFLSLISFWTNLWTRQGRRRIVWVLGLGALLLVLGSSPGVAQQAGQVSGEMTDADAMTAIELDAENLPDGLMRLYREGLYSEAIQKLEQVIEHEQNATRKAILQVNLGRLYSEVGRQLIACRTLKKAFGIETDICNEEESTNLQEEVFTRDLIKGSLSKLNATQAKSLIILGSTLRKIGELDTSRQVLEESLKLLSELELSLNEIYNLNSSLSSTLGDTYRALGNLERDRGSIPQYDYIPWEFRRRYKVANSNSFEKAISLYELSLDNYKSSVSILQKSLEQDTNISLAQIKKNQALINLSKLNQISVLINQLGITRENNLTKLNEALAIANDLESSNSFDDLSNHNSTLKIYADITLSKNLNYLNQIVKKYGLDDLRQFSEERILDFLESSINESKNIKGESKILSEGYSIGSLGGFYEYLSIKYSQPKNIYQQSFSKYNRLSIQKTFEAINTIQRGQYPIISYQLKWQIGRLLDSKRKNLSDHRKSSENQIPKYKQEIIGFYRSAVFDLESARDSLQSINSNTQYSFRDDVEPVYRELVDLILEGSQVDQRQLIEARSLVDRLQLSELENFFQCKLNRDIRISIDEKIQDVDNTLVVYPIILKNRIEVIVKTKGIASKSRLESLPVDDTPYLQVEEVINDFRAELTRGGEYFRNQGKDLGNTLYTWLIKPLEDKGLLEENDTIILVLDGPFRSIPIASLYDKEQKRFLVEKYKLAISTGLDVSETNIERKLSALIVGQSLDVGVNELPSLPNVSGDDGEVETIAQKLRDNRVGNVKTLLDEGLTTASLEAEAEAFSYSVIHIATHGQFSSDPEETYIIPAPNEKIQLNTLTELFKENSDSVVELLVLSACETAEGDRRAILGLAGITTIRSGTRSTLGSLWSVDDESTAIFMRRFYEELLRTSGSSETRVNKAEALRNTQLAFLEEDKRDIYTPYHWAPFILVGDWQTKLIP